MFLARFAQRSASTLLRSSTTTTTTAAGIAIAMRRAMSTEPDEVKQSIPTYWNPHLPAEQQDKLLFTPGPLTTSYATKAAMLRDLGSRDDAMIAVVKSVRERMLKLAGVSPDEWVATPVQGSGTFGVESVVCSAVPKTRGILLLVNGAYGARVELQCKAHNVPYHVMAWPEDVHPSVEEVDAYLAQNAAAGDAKIDFSHIFMVHSETTSGIVNDLPPMGALAKRHGLSYFVDAMSSFGGYEIDMAASNIDFLVTSANKCIEGVPGFAWVLAKKSALAVNAGKESSLSLAISPQEAGLAANGQFRFTPPTHTLLAFSQALDELDMEGGVAARIKRYQENQRTLQAGMEALGFELYLPLAIQGHTISSYRYPTDKNWDFARFYAGLNELDFVIYPGKLTNADCFRIGHIGRIFPRDTENLLVAIDKVCRQMKTAKYAE